MTVAVAVAVALVDIRLGSRLPAILLRSGVRLGDAEPANDERGSSSDSDERLTNGTSHSEEPSMYV